MPQSSSGFDLSTILNGAAFSVFATPALLYGANVAGFPGVVAASAMGSFLAAQHIGLLNRARHPEHIRVLDYAKGAFAAPLLAAAFGAAMGIADPASGEAAPQSALDSVAPISYEASCP